MKPIDRRTFLTRVAFFAGASWSLPFLLPRMSAVRKEGASDEELFRVAVSGFSGAKAEAMPIGELIAALGISFIGTPYVAHSLEVPGEERLVVNLRAFDCTTFVESMLALARCLKLSTVGFNDFQRELQFVRYRGGIIAGYPSRLHYFTDWIHDNQQKETLHDVTKELGGTPYRKKIDFMTTHTASYRQLADRGNVDRLKVSETALNERDRYLIAKVRLPFMVSKICNGDVIGITTTMEGMDVSHIGLAVVKDGAMRLLHAPFLGGAVELSSGSLAEYLGGHKKQTGIIIARVQEPQREQLR